MAERRTSTVVVTGASAGVGRATAIAFARRGYQVGLIARSVEGLLAAQADVEKAGGKGLVLPADVSDPHALEAVAERVEQELGPIDVWVNSAMVTSFSPFSEMTPEEFRRITEVTYLGEVYGTMVALRRMQRRDRGTIVQVGSALAYRAIPLQSAYCGAKHAIRGFTDSLRSELIHDGSRIRLTMVQLPALNTPQFDWARSRLPRQPQPVPPIFEPEVAAEAIYKAAMKAPRELWVGKPAVQTILGNMLMPGWADRLLAKWGYSGQISDEPVRRERRDNLYAPPPVNYSVHGRFESQAKPRALAVDAGTIRKALFAVVLGLAVLDFLAGYRVGRKSVKRSRSGHLREPAGFPPYLAR